jgi:DnaK suppressor protein
MHATTEAMESIIWRAISKQIRLEAMNIESLKQRLLQKKRELQANIARLEKEARDSGGAEVRDAMDDATSAQGASEALQEDVLESDTLIEVEDALQRIEDGTYGKCIDCGRPIEAARLEAVPWAAYCLEDQAKRDQAARVPQSGVSRL